MADRSARHTPGHLTAPGPNRNPSHWAASPDRTLGTFSRGCPPVGPPFPCACGCISDHQAQNSPSVRVESYISDLGQRLGARSGRTCRCVRSRSMRRDGRASSLHLRTRNLDALRAARRRGGRTCIPWTHSRARHADLDRRQAAPVSATRRSGRRAPTRRPGSGQASARPRRATSPCGGRIPRAGRGLCGRRRSSGLRGARNRSRRPTPAGASRTTR